MTITNLKFITLDRPTLLATLGLRHDHEHQVMPVDDALTQLLTYLASTDDGPNRRSAVFDAFVHYYPHCDPRKLVQAKAA